MSYRHKGKAQGCHPEEQRVDTDTISNMQRANLGQRLNGNGEPESWDETYIL